MITREMGKLLSIDDKINVHVELSNGEYASTDKYNYRPLTIKDLGGKMQEYLKTPASILHGSCVYVEHVTGQIIHLDMCVPWRQYE